MATKYINTIKKALVFTHKYDVRIEEGGIVELNVEDPHVKCLVQTGVLKEISTTKPATK